jgi:regulatory protein
MWRKRVAPINDDERVVTDEERSRKRTMGRAVRLLAAKPRSIGELRQRLLEKRWTNQAIVDTVIEKLEEYKYVDDRQYAASLAAAKLRQKPQGKRRLDRTLSQKQLDREVVRQAVDEAFETTPESELLDQAIEKRVRIKGCPDSPEDAKKLRDHLMRLGFPIGLVVEKVNALTRGDDT